MSGEIQRIREALWAIHEGLTEDGALDPDEAEARVSVLDSLIVLLRLESQEGDLHSSRAFERLNRSLTGGVVPDDS